jgi:hypothetical protein
MRLAAKFLPTAQIRDLGKVARSSRVEVVHFQRYDFGLVAPQDQPRPLVVWINCDSIGDYLGFASVCPEMEGRAPTIASANDSQLDGRGGSVRGNVATRGIIE